MSLVLLIDDDPGTLQGFEGLLRAAGFEVATAQSAKDGIALARHNNPDLVIADLRLPDRSGLDVLRELRRTHIDARLVVVTGFGSVRSAVEAMQLGASDYVEKPLIGDELLRVVQRALPGAAWPDADLAVECTACPEAHAYSRWAHAMVRVIDSPVDPKTLDAWARCVTASPSTLKNWCRTADVSPKRSLLLARLLRVVVLPRPDGYRAEDYLDVGDKRTLLKLLRLGGTETGEGADLPHDVDDFLTRQELIRQPAALRELQRALKTRRTHHSFLASAV